jgi:hypothetical protein
MKRFFKVDMEGDGFGLLVNEGSAEAPRFRMVLKGSERWMDRMAADMNECEFDGNSRSKVAEGSQVIHRHD